MFLFSFDQYWPNLLSSLTGDLEKHSNLSLPRQLFHSVWNPVYLISHSASLDWAQQRVQTRPRFSGPCSRLFGSDRPRVWHCKH